ncbi:hypothetical protein FA13DRAFT_1737109 [Coprinellus micaceus]|uniref:Uncharacterized protein n=1 Tax=Coprinellus micaceus TaxID=71717 RepID=A0A4Y7SXS6_COPMI|nr:hypothetical protein FA13DRAFT_1737109 [Coprinellus micaceus]
MAPQAIMLRVLLRQDTHTRSRTAEEEILEFADAQPPPGVILSSRSVDSLSLSPSLASTKDEGDSVSRRTIPQEGRKEYDEDSESGVQLEEGNVTKVQRAQLST